MRIRAAVIRERGGPFVVQEVELEDPRDDEVIVEVRAVGICHTDVGARDGDLPLPLPLIAGHEGAGVVERVGRAVTRVAPGDRVVMTIATCGSCRMCEGGRPSYCLHASQMNSTGRRRDGSTAYHDDAGTVYGHFNGQSSFATHAIAAERSVFPIPDEVSFELAAPLGCGIQTGAGSVMNYLRPGVATSLAVLGVGPVGLSSIMAAAVVGSSPIVAVDVNADRLALAAELGATHTIDTTAGSLTDGLAEILPDGVDHVIDTTCVRPLIEEAIGALSIGGVMALVGVAPPDMRLEVDPMWLVRGRTITGIRVGDSRPGVFIPYLLALHAQGRFPYDRMITPCGGLDDVDAAARRSAAGEVVKAVLTIA